MAAMQKALLVSRDASLWELLKGTLAKGGYVLKIIPPKTARESYILRFLPSVVFLDINILENEARRILETLQEEKVGPVPIFGLGQAMPEAAETIKALDLGMEDLLPRHIAPDLLLARVRSCQRRYSGGGEENIVTSKKGGMKIDRGTRKILVRNIGRHLKSNGRGVSYVSSSPLTRKEFSLLCLMVSREGHVWTRQNLLSLVCGSDKRDHPRVVDKHIEALREKLGPASDYIRTVPGVGYIFTEEEP